MYLPAFGDFVAGFSYGAIGAIRHALQDESVKNLILLSPAYYTHKDREFKEAQLSAFEADPALYKLKLLKKSGLKEEEGELYGKDGVAEELRELLFFDWCSRDVASLVARGVRVEVFIGLGDRVVEPEPSSKFFDQFAKVYTLENKNHILR
jgi:pimeloyl-ACP methyl ester carboxylesterase